MDDADFRSLPDLAVRSLGGSVVYANDELFAERENLIRPERPGHDPASFGPKGKVYDGWETRRRREAGHDVAIVRLGAPGIVRGVVVDTAWFTGNYPPEVSVEAAYVDGYPSAEELVAAARWESLVPRSTVAGDAENVFGVDDERCWTHVRLSIYPDGGVARLRVHGEVVPDPHTVGAGGLDLAALDNGARIVGCSNWFYSSPNNLLLPDRPRSMADGWETARRRDDGNDWATVRLVAAGVVEVAELDTTYFVGNAPGWARLTGSDADGGDVDDSAAWPEILPRTRLQPDTRHRIRLPAAGPSVTHVRLDIYPDGGLARLRLLGALTSDGRAALERRWQDARPR